MFHKYQFSFDKVSPSVETLMRYLQIPDKESYSLVEETIHKTFAALKDTNEIIGGYQIKECQSIHTPEGKVICTETTLHTGRKISRYMQGATQIALFICTAGKRITKLAHFYQQNGDFLEAFVVDSIGSATVENAMDKIHLELEKEMNKEGKKITNRYSPGYCEWALSDQQSLFTAIGPHPTGITLTDSCLMQPIKSVSGIIGIGTNVKKRPYGCAICSSNTCIYRKILTKTV